MSGRWKPDPRRANGHRRNQLRARVYAEESTCWLCDKPVDTTLGKQPGIHSARCVTEQRDCAGCVYHPLSPTLDEIVPVSKGGDPYARANVRLAHRVCNRARGNDEPAAHRPPAALATSRDW